jgi:hypothetical protein
MGKSLTETAKNIIMNESNDPTPDRDAKKITPNMATLKPGGEFSPGGVSKSYTGRFANPRNANDPSSGKGPGVPPRWTPPDGQSPEEHIEIDAVVTPTDPRNIGALSAGSVGKDTSRSSRAPVGPEPIHEDKDDDGKEQAFKDEANRRMTDPDRRSRTRTSHGHNGTDPRRQGAAKDKGEKMDEEVEISEELEAFIEKMIEEGHSDEEIAAAIEENFEFEEQDSGEVLEEEEATEQPVIEIRSIKEDVDALLEGEQLSEDFRKKAETIFESAVLTRVQQEVAVLEEAYAKSLQEEINNVVVELQEHVDQYLSYVAEEWVKENEIAIESGLKTELTEDFISGLRNLFAEHYIDIPDEKVDVLEEMNSKLEQLENQLNEEIKKNVEYSKVINEASRSLIIAEACEGLTDTQAEKLKVLAENIGFTTPEEYSEKVQTLSESYFKKKPTPGQATLDSYDNAESGKELISEEARGPMEHYVRALGRTKK